MNNKDEVAKRLIDWHFLVEPEMVEIYRFISPNDENAPSEPIKLLEVSDATFETGRVDTFGFGPADDITFPSVVALVTPDEMRRIRQGEIPLPNGWNLATAQHFTAPRVAHAA
jgi:hypothetical protein